jgi:hypothetical protein
MTSDGEPLGPRRTSIASRNRLPLFALLGANVISSVGNAGVQSTA